MENKKTVVNEIRRIEDATLGKKVDAKIKPIKKIK